MTTKFFLFCLTSMALTSGWASAQTPAPASAAAPTPTPAPSPVAAPATTAAPAAPSADPAMDAAKVAEFQKRFEAGYALEKAGQYAQARSIYDSILADEPKAKRSLLEAGKVSIKLNEPLKANDYLDKLHAIVPDFPEAIELLIQVNQTLKRDVKVELLIRQFKQLHDSGTNAPFSASQNFCRERIPLPGGEEMVVLEFFDYHTKPNTKWMGKVVASNGAVKRQFELIYDPEATREIRAKDPKYANTEEFLLIEDVITGDQITRVDAYNQIFALPEYKKVRNTMLAIASNALKPIYSQQIDPSAR